MYYMVKRRENQEKFQTHNFNESNKVYAKIITNEKTDIQKNKISKKCRNLEK